MTLPNKPLDPLICPNCDCLLSEDHACVQCGYNGHMKLHEVGMDEQEPVTIDDLDRIFIRAKADDSERYVSISVKEASDRQFDTWAKSRVQILGNDEPWRLEERADFCNRLWQNGELVMLKKESE